MIGIFTRKHKAKEPLSVVKPGTQRRAFTYIDDIIDGLILAGEKGASDSYCIGSKKTYSVMAIAKLFGDKIEMLPEKKGDRRSSTIDLSKMNKLGWSAKYSVEDYIKSIIKS